jgi:hypothetical protein
MKLRSVMAVVAGWIAWVTIFWGIMIVEASLWPAMAEAARDFFATGSYAGFDTAMLWSFQGGRRPARGLDPRRACNRRRARRPARHDPRALLAASVALRA